MLLGHRYLDRGEIFPRRARLGCRRLDPKNKEGRNHDEDKGQLLVHCSLQRKGLVAQNVATAMRIKADDRNTSGGPLRAGPDFPSAELSSVIEGSTGRWRPLVITAIFTGMRASELRGLPWRDVDLEAGIAHVRQRADAWNNIGPPKSKAGKPDIPLAPIVVNALEKWKEECPKGELDLVFPTGVGNVESHSNLYDRFWQPLLQIGPGMAVN